jgi:hypothetical protein
MERDKVLSTEEAKIIRRVIQYGSGGFAILSAGGKLERTLEGVKFAAETVIDNDAATVVVGNGADQVSKANRFIKITKKR